LDLKGFAKRLDELGSGGLERIIKPVLVRSALDTEAKAKVNATTVLHVRTGRLRNSIAGFVRDTQGGFEVVASAGGSGGLGEVPYAGVHEYGATITPKKGQYLTIPHGPALTPAGVSRYPSARNVPGLSFRRTKNGNGILVKDGQVWYFLVRRVVIPKRPYLRPALNEATKNLSEQIGAALLKEIG
jgi:phage gpG-like protein